MTDWSEKFAEEIDDLRRVRDELRVQIHLGKEEAKQRWEEVERRWSHLEAKLKLVREESKDSLEDIGEAGKTLLEEIRNGYRHVRKLL